MCWMIVELNYIIFSLIVVNVVKRVAFRFICNNSVSEWVNVFIVLGFSLFVVKWESLIKFVFMVL